MKRHREKGEKGQRRHRKEWRAVAGAAAGESVDKGPAGLAFGGSTAGQGNKGGAGKHHGRQASLCQQVVTLLLSCLEHHSRKTGFAFH